MKKESLIEQIVKDKKLFESSEIQMDPEDYAWDIANDASNLRSSLAKVYGKYGQEMGQAITNYVFKCLQEDTFPNADEMSDMIKGIAT